MQVFDRRLLRSRRDRAAAGIDQHRFLFDVVSARLADRLLDVNRAFPCVLDLGTGCGAMARALDGRGGINTLVSSDVSGGMMRGRRMVVVADEECLPFKACCFDAVISNLSLHWVNDLPGSLVQVRNVLKPDGLFLAALFGGETLKELRLAMMEAELTSFGGMSPRISPFIDMRDMGALLQRAGFALPVTDCDTLTVSYADVWALMRDLKGMGESNVISTRIRQGGSRRFFERVASFYPKDKDGRIVATFQVIHAIGWAPHESQQKALRPGSAQHRLSDALGVDEVKL